MRSPEKPRSRVRWSSQTALLCFLSVAFLVVGCAGLKQGEIVAKAVDATSGVDTYRSETTSDLLVSSLSGSSGNQTLMRSTISSSAVVDIAGRRSHVHLDMPAPAGEWQIESYIVEGYSYAQSEAQWIKWKIPDGYWEARDQILLYTDILKAASQVTGRGRERVNGIDSYVVVVTPRLDTLDRESRMQIFGPLLLVAIGATEATPFLDVLPPSLEITVTYWIDRSTFLLNQVQIAISFDVEDKVEKNVDITHRIRFHDYSEEITISLPPEAQEATEMPR